MKYIEIKAPAKINIGLNIFSKRKDGYHNLSTLFYPINDLYDILTFEPAEQFEFICTDDSIPCDESNLVVKAKNLLEKVSEKKIKVKITLDKKIPHQAGLGGGSSDAAAALISLNEMFRLGLKDDKLIELALLIGSDVPFF
ncbi:MAG: 4-(cytidine 5'-diphospho)-2-C-methyl-D-erythritol kinase, partial [Bacteroidota bacterium]